MLEDTLFLDIFDQFTIWNVSQNVSKYIFNLHKNYIIPIVLLHYYFLSQAFADILTFSNICLQTILLQIPCLAP